MTDNWRMDIIHNHAAQLAKELATKHDLQLCLFDQKDVFKYNWYKPYVAFRLRHTKFDIDFFFSDRSRDLCLDAIPKLLKLRLPIIRPSVWQLAGYTIKNSPTYSILSFDTVELANIEYEIYHQKAMQIDDAVTRLKSNPIQSCVKAVFQVFAGSVADEPTG